MAVIWSPARPTLHTRHSVRFREASGGPGKGCGSVRATGGSPAVNSASSRPPGPSGSQDFCPEARTGGPPSTQRHRPWSGTLYVTGRVGPVPGSGDSSRPAPASSAPASAPRTGDPNGRLVTVAATERRRRADWKSMLSNLSADLVMDEEI